MWVVSLLSSEAYFERSFGGSTRRRVFRVSAPRLKEASMSRFISALQVLLAACVAEYRPLNPSNSQLTYLIFVSQICHLVSSTE